MPHDATGRLRTVVAMPPVIEELIFNDALRARLGAIADVSDPAPLFPLDAEDAPARLAGAEVLLTSWACPRIDESVLALAPKLRLIAHAAGTVKELVAPACFERGVRVVSAASANAVPVAEFTLGAILLGLKQAFAIRELYRGERRGAGYWAHRRPGVGGYQKRIGIVGASRIGRRVIELLRPFDVSVAVADPYLSETDAHRLGAEKRELHALLAEADVVSLHAPNLPETRHMIGADELARIRDGGLLINTARGALVDHAALEKELVSGRLSAVIDTTDPEVLPEDSPLYDLPNVFLTPHIAGSQGSETWRMTELALDEIERFTNGAPLEHEVRAEDWDRIA